MQCAFQAAEYEEMDDVLSQLILPFSNFILARSLAPGGDSNQARHVQGFNARTYPEIANISFKGARCFS